MKGNDPMLDIVAGDGVDGYGFEGYSVVDEHELGMTTLGPVEVDEAFEAYAETDLSDLELLSVALQDAMDARAAGELAGPALDEVALRRAERRARRADAQRVMRSVEGSLLGDEGVSA